MKLLVDSQARLPRLSSNNVLSSQIKYNYQFVEDTGNVRCMRLKTALVPRSFYAVVAGWSQRFEYVEGASTARFVNLPEGTYDAQTLATELSALLTAVTAGFTVTYDDKTNKLTFVNATGGNISFPDPTVGLTTTAPDPATVDVLGLGNPGTTTVIGNGTSFTAPNMVNMSVPSYLFLTVSSGSVNNSSGIRDWYTRRQYMIPFGETPYLGIKEQAVNSQFEQCERIDNQVFRTVLVEWTTGIPDVQVETSAGTESIKGYPLSFNGVDHTLVFETS